MSATILGRCPTRVRNCEAKYSAVSNGTTAGIGFSGAPACGARDLPLNVCSTRSSSFDVQLRGMRVHGIGCRVLPFVHHTRRTLASQSPLLPSRNVKQGRHKNYTLHPSGSGSEGVAIGFPPCAGIPSWRPRRRARGSAATSLLRAHRHHLGSNLGSATEPARQPTSLPTIPEA